MSPGGQCHELWWEESDGGNCAVASIFAASLTLLRTALESVDDHCGFSRNVARSAPGAR
jgi:hypothetical protein